MNKEKLELYRKQLSEHIIRGEKINLAMLLLSILEAILEE